MSSRSRLRETLCWVADLAASWTFGSVSLMYVCSTTSRRWASEPVARAPNALISIADTMFSHRWSSRCIGDARWCAHGVMPTPEYIWAYSLVRSTRARRKLASCWSLSSGVAAAPERRRICDLVRYAF